MTIDEIKQFASFVLIRVGWGAVASAVVLLGGIYFIVDTSLRGLEKAIDTTNERITSLENSVGRTINEAIANLETRLRIEFQSTREEIKKAGLIEPQFRDSSGKEISIALRSDAKPLEQLVRETPGLSDWVKEFDVKVPASNSEGFFYTFAASPGWNWRSDIASGAVSQDDIRKQVSLGLTSPESMIASGCFSQTLTMNGSVQLIPVADKAVAGNDGVICLVDSAAPILNSKQYN